MGGDKVLTLNISTNDLSNALEKSNDLHGFIEKNQEALLQISLPDYLKKLLAEKKLVKAEVIARSGLAKIYAYQIFSGKRSPTRKKVLALALAMYLSTSECNCLLRQAQCNALYPKCKFDLIVIFALKEGFSVMETNEVLYDYGLGLLE